MSRLLYILLVLAIAYTPATWAQAPSEASKTKTIKAPVVTPQTTPQSNKKEEDCACEWQVLPEVLATVNGIRVTRKDIEDQTTEQIDRLKRQIIEARKRELDLQINSKLVALEAARRSVSVSKLIEEEIVARVKEATEAEAQAF